MREVSSVFEKGFLKGLRAERNVPNNQETLIKSYNLVPNQYGLQAREIVNMPFTQYRTERWPWPLLVITSRYIFLFTSQELYLVNPETWEVRQLLGFTEWGDVPHFADFMQTVIWSTPKNQWMYDGSTITTNLHDATFKTCCEFKGQLIVGNCRLPDGPEKVGRDITRTTKVGDALTVGWSKIGALDWEYTLGNEVGWAPMPWLGEVSVLKPLGDRVMVYGSNGVAKMRPVSEPVTTFGIEQYGIVGPLNRNVVAGDSSAHVFLGTDRNLYLVVPERALSAEGKEPLRLGYSEFLRDIENPIISYDAGRKHWWIAGTNKCFIFTDNGLGEASISPSSVARYNGELFGEYLTHGEPVAIVMTGPMSFNSRGIKTLMAIEADVRGKATIFGKAIWRKDYYTTFQPGKKIMLDPRGFFFPVLSGVEFIVALECEDFKDFQVSKMWLRYKRTDKHSARGVIDAGAPEQ